MSTIKKLSTSKTVLISFMLVILLGSFLLVLPISSSTGESVGYIDALFMSTTSVCVTGLVTLPTATTWSLFGKIVILCLIQIGGLGVITILAYLGVVFKKRFSLSSNMLIMDALNITTAYELKQIVAKIVIGSLCVEIMGAACYMFVFVPEFGLRGIWIAFFNSVSAFCNAGIDIIGVDSLCGYVTNPIVNIVTMCLIIIGGLGFIVWWDILNGLRHIRKHRGHILKYLSLHSKIVLSMSVILIVVGALVIFCCEYNNALTIGNFTIQDKILASVFQSVTTRTAGFATIPQENFTNSSSIISLILMFIGGSPVGTAGGVKTITIFVLIMTVIAVLKGKQEVNCFNRRIEKEAIYKAVTVVVASLSVLILFTVLLSLCINTDFMNILYETVSATGTVGLSRNLTGSLPFMGKIVIILNMLFGRVGPITVLTSYVGKGNSVNIRNPKGSITIG